MVEGKAEAWFELVKARSSLASVGKRRLFDHVNRLSRRGSSRRLSLSMQLLKRSQRDRLTAPLFFFRRIANEVEITKDQPRPINVRVDLLKDL